jgi:hypothetical protein
MPDVSNSVGGRHSWNAPPWAPNPTDLFDILAHKAQNQLGTIGQTSFFLGDGLQRAATDLAFDLLTPRNWYPNNLWRLVSEGAKESIRISKFAASPADVILACQELRNKVEVFNLVKDLPSKLDLPSYETGEFIPLAQLVPRAYEVSPFQALWAVEGLGHYYADSYYAHFGNPKSLLSEAQAPVPPKSLLMLHAGMGLSFADRLLGNLNIDDPSETETRAALEEFVSLCRSNSREGYMGAAIESLGLETRVFYPELLPVVHSQFVKVAPELTGFFWHGAGRALYFSREYFLPGLTTVWSGVVEETRSFPDRQSAMAGLAWAFTLVNMGRPAIMENLLRRQPERFALETAFTNGVVSSIIMRQDTTPDAPTLLAFNNYQPADSQRSAVWKYRIAEPAEHALGSIYPLLQEERALDQVFRYSPLAELAMRPPHSGGAVNSDQAPATPSNETEALQAAPTVASFAG